MFGFKKVLGGVAFGVVVLSLASGCKKDAPPQESTVTSAAAPAATPPALTRQVGDKVDVQWNGSWWKGKILAVQDGKYRVHYTGWAASWDENVAPERVRDATADAKLGSTPEPDETAAAPSATATVAAAPSAAAKAPTATAATFAVGSKVDANWKGTWYQAKILSKVGDSSYRLHYIGWASSWDETVPASRLRPFTGTASKGSTPE